MRHWTQDASHHAGLFAVGSGSVGLAIGKGWPAVAVFLGGLLLLGLLRALETRDENSAGKAALTKCEALEARLGVVEAIAEEGKKVALSASIQASARSVGKAPTF